MYYEVRDVDHAFSIITHRLHDKTNYLDNYVLRRLKQ